MFQDIAPDEYDNDFSFLRAGNEDKLIVYRDKAVLAYVEGETFRAPTFADFALEPKGASHPEAMCARTDERACADERARTDERACADERIVSPKVLLAHADPLAHANGTNEEEHSDETGSSPSSSTPEVLIAYEDPIAQGAFAADSEMEVPYIYLFKVGNDAYFMVDLPDRAIDHLAEQSGWEFLPLAQLVNYQPKALRFALMVGYEYWTWYQSSQYCGRCGAKTEHDALERMMRCPECGLMIFPKVFPAVIVGITRDDGKVLATRYAGRPYSNYALVAGYCEMGETVEQTVHREVMEEVGLRVKNLRYYKSQPWPDSSSLLFGFFCEVDGPSEIVLDEHELSYAEWLDRSELLEDNDHSLTREMMGVLRDGRETDYGLLGPQK